MLPSDAGHTHVCWACRASWVHDNGDTYCTQRESMTCPACLQASTDAEPWFVTDSDITVEDVCEECKRYDGAVRCEERDGYHYTEFANGGRMLSAVQRWAFGFTGREIRA